MEHQPQLCLRKGDRTAAIKIDAMKNQSALDNYFLQLKSILDADNLGDKPGQIYNMDETGIPLDHCSPRVLAKRGQKKVRYCSTGNKSQITVVGCINAIGQALPPFFDPCVSRSQNSESSNGSTPMVEGDLQQPNDNDSSHIIDKDRIESFMAEEEILYQTRYSEGYDLNDTKYISWLKINHPSEDCDKFCNLMMHFPNASIPEEIPVSLDSVSTDDNTALESDDQLVEPVDVCEAILPGLTPVVKMVVVLKV